MQQFVMENPFVTLLIVLAVLATLRAIVRTVIPWARRDRDDSED